MNYKILGGAWITSKGVSLLSETDPISFSPDNKEIDYKAAKKSLDKVPSRWGRFDNYTRCGFIASTLALKDAGLLKDDGTKQSIPVILGSYSDCYTTDRAFWESAEDNSGAFASPNKFSYTLPNVVVGEIAATNKLTGATLTVEEHGEIGTMAIKISKTLGIKDNQPTLIGWSDSCDQFNGALFLVIEGINNLPETSLFELVKTG